MESLIARAVQVLIALGGAYILTLWFALVVWTFQDIQARSRSVVAQIFSTLVVMIFSIPGIIIYLVLRPRYTLDDAFQRSLEEEYLMQDLEELPLCPGCQQYVEDGWVFCPNCRTELRDNCIACDQLIDVRWEICPYCGTEQYEDEDMLPAPHVQPVLSPSPQFIGRPQLSPAQVFQLTEHEDRTRPIIPATVRVDFRSGDIATEEAPLLPISARIRSVDGGVPQRRVLLDGTNGARDDFESATDRDIGPTDSEHSQVSGSPEASEVTDVTETDVAEASNAGASEAQAEPLHSEDSSMQEGDEQPSDDPKPEPKKQRRARRQQRKKRRNAESKPQTGDE